MQRSATSRRPLGERLINSPLRFLLFPLWLLYRPIIGLRNLAYDHGWLKSQRAQVPVISVGNIIVGGSGKTPLVTLLLHLLADRYQCHVVSRGYKGDGNSNDEALLMPVPVHCHSKRIIACQQACDAAATAIIVDDGFQHRQLHRDCDIVLIDASRPWGHSDQLRGAVLPLGFLRESPRGLQRADCLILSRCDQVSPQRLAQLQQQLQRFHKPVLTCQHQASHLSTWNAEQGSLSEPRALNELQQQKLLLVSGIAHPQAFSRSVESLGYHIADQLIFADHHHYTAADVAMICARAQELEAAVLCTSKDAVKLQTCWPAAQADLHILHIQMAFSAADQAQLQQCLDSKLAPAATPPA